MIVTRANYLQTLNYAGIVNRDEWLPRKGDCYPADCMMVCTSVKVKFTLWQRIKIAFGWKPPYYPIVAKFESVVDGGAVALPGGK